MGLLYFHANRYFKYLPLIRNVPRKINLMPLIMMIRIVLQYFLEVPESTVLVGILGRLQNFAV